MTFGQMPTGEKEPAQWELMNPEKDTTSVREMGDAEEAEIAAEFGESKFPIFSILEEKETMPMLYEGLILRRGDEDIGYIRWKTKGEDLSIINLYIRKTERSPGLIRKLIIALKEHAEKTGVKRIRWETKRLVNKRMSKSIPGADMGHMGFEIPVEQLDVALLLGWIDMRSEIHSV